MMTRTGWRKPLRGKNLANLFGICCFFRKAKGSVLAHLTCRTQESAQSGAAERAAHADSFDSESRELGHTQLRCAQSHDHVNRTINRLDDSCYVFLAREAGCVQHVGTRFLIGLQSGDCVFEIRSAVQVILRPRGQSESKWKRSRRLNCGSNSVGCELFVIDWVILAPGGVLDGPADRASSGGQTNRFCRLFRRITEAILEVGAHGEICG